MSERSRVFVSAASTALLLALPFLAFSVGSRKEIGKRDNWTCQYPGCDDGTGKPKSFAGGWMVFASHTVTHDKESPIYDKPSSGRIQCIEHEIATHQALLHLAQQHNDADDIRHHSAALRKLNSVDWRTTAYRKCPSDFE